MPARPNPFNVVRQFEQAMAVYTGATYAVATDSCTSALFLTLKYIADHHVVCEEDDVMTLPVEVPRKTFISVPMQVCQAGLQPKLVTRSWKGWYRLHPFWIWDSACRLRADLFREALKEQDAELSGDTEPWPPCYVCLSFQYRKHIPIGRGGMILHNDVRFNEWARKARFYGRSECELEQDTGPTFMGWRKYMTPTEASQGLSLLHRFPDSPPDLDIKYPDLATVPVLRQFVEI